MNALSLYMSVQLGDFPTKKALLYVPTFLKTGARKVSDDFKRKKLNSLSQSLDKSFFC